MTYFPLIKSIHIFAALLSGAIFALRGIGVLAGARLAMAKPVRIGTYTIDTVLLVSALVLAAMLPGAVFANGWLTVKVALVVAYIVLGVFALKRGRTAVIRLVCYLLALLVYVAVLIIARTHDPKGPLRLLGFGAG